MNGSMAITTEQLYTLLEHIDNKLYIAICAVIFIFCFIIPRDFYVVIRELRFISPNESAKATTIARTSIHCFNDYLAARAFYDFHNSQTRHESEQNINYLYALPAFTAKNAGAKMAKKVHRKAKLLAETSVDTPHS